MASRKGSSQKLSKPNRNPPNVTWQHSWSSSETATGLAESRLGRLPPEVLLQIFKGLSVHDLGNISLTCRALKIIADQDDIWKLKCKSSTKIQSKSFKEVYMDWMHEKYLRNIELEAVEAEYMERRSQVACGMRCGPPQYPIRPDGKHDFGAVGGFKEHPNQSSTMSIDLSVDIDKMAKELLSLLEKAEKFKATWRESSVIKRMITRYYRFLQLKASMPSSVLLIPTLDIEIIWQTHLLRPTMYHDDCLRLFHRIIDHSLLTSDIEQFLKEKAFIETCKLYEERFGEEYCPLPEDKQGKTPAPRYGHQVFSKLECFIPNYLYWDETYFKFESLSTPNHDDNPFSFTEADVILDSNWLSLCKKFMIDMERKLKIDRYERYEKHLRLGHALLERLKKSYERFLYLATKYPPSNGYQFVHPTYAIDIIWHSHMQEPLKYVADCQRLVGYLVDHAPWPSVDSNKMKNSCDDTANVWKKEFDSDMQTDHLFNTKNGELDWHYD